MCNGFMIDNLDCGDVASFLSSIRDCRGMFAEADGARICFDSAGTGEPVVMIGGFAAGRDPPLPKDPDDPVKLMHQLMAIDVSDRERHEPDLHVPTLVIHGDEDIMVPCYEGRKVSDLIPDSRFLLLKGQGHGIPVKAYAESLLEFMSEHPIAER